MSERRLVRVAFLVGFLGTLAAVGLAMLLEP
jgi:uncharacterized protein involved in exopolysaccharide biosynthesis